VGDMLSQAEIDALLKGTSIDEIDSGSTGNNDGLTEQEVDALGEIGNICMGTSATTLFTLLGQRVKITTPNVSITTWEEMCKEYTLPYVAVKVEYTSGLIGSNFLILQEQDTKIITDLMMGGDGSAVEGEISDLHLSAISEAMNQMIGSSATSMSSMFDKRINISPPKAFTIKFSSDSPQNEISSSGSIVKIAFKMEIGDIVDSEIMQLIPISFAKEMVANLLKSDDGKEMEKSPDINVNVEVKNKSEQKQQAVQPETSRQEYREEGYNREDYQPNGSHRSNRPVNVQPAQFQSFEDDIITIEKKNINLIMDVPLQVTVELGRTHKLIKDILEFSTGSIIELDKLAGEPVDILVNGKPVAKGEVVVIDESFGVRITDIIHPSKRL
jgi:flagellar motor switch protein FliN/FliY